MRLSTQTPIGGGGGRGGGYGAKRNRFGRQLSELGAPTGTSPYGTNELVGRKIWCARLVQ
jgi:hypothetical protein